MLTEKQMEKAVEVISYLDFNMFDKFIDMIGMDYVYSKNDVREIVWNSIKSVYENNLVFTETARVLVFRNNETDDLHVVLAVDSWSTS